MITNFRTAAMALAICFSGVALSARAQTSIQPLAAPDPADIIAPNVNVAPSRGDENDYDTYFYFHKTGVTYQRAFADLDECRMFAEAGQLTSIPPIFVPLGNTLVKEDRFKGSDVMLRYGLVGSIIVGVIVANAEDDNRRATMRRCMMYKGYNRYGTSSDVWDDIDRGPDALKLARQALIASGPQPLAGAIAP